MRIAIKCQNLARIRVSSVWSVLLGILAFMPFFRPTAFHMALLIFCVGAVVSQGRLPFSFSTLVAACFFRCFCTSGRRRASCSEHANIPNCSRRF